MRRRVCFLSTEFDPLSLAEAAQILIQHINQGHRGWVATINTAILVEMQQDAFLRDFSRNALLSLVDGQPLVWAARLFGVHLPERVAGIDLIEALCARAAEESVPIYLLGAAPGVAEAVSCRLQQIFPKLIVAGSSNGFFGEEDALQKADAIRASGAAIVFVAMGVPRQERFIADYWDALGVSVALPVGGSFDVLSGRLPRAPVIMRKLGLEWAFRLSQEPKRLFKRYLTTNTVFLWLLCRELLQPKGGRAS